MVCVCIHFCILVSSPSSKPKDMRNEGPLYVCFTLIGGLFWILYVECNINVRIEESRGVCASISRNPTSERVRQEIEV